MINSNILKTWNEERIKYQIRYAKSCIKYHEDPTSFDNRGHMNEQCWVLCGKDSGQVFDGVAAHIQTGVGDRCCLAGACGAC